MSDLHDTDPLSMLELRLDEAHAKLNMLLEAEPLPGVPAEVRIRAGTAVELNEVLDRLAKTRPAADPFAGLLSMIMAGAGGATPVSFSDPPGMPRPARAPYNLMRFHVSLTPAEGDRAHEDDFEGQLELLDSESREVRLSVRFDGTLPLTRRPVFEPVPEAGTDDPVTPSQDA